MSNRDGVPYSQITAMSETNLTIDSLPEDADLDHLAEAKNHKVELPILTPQPSDAPHHADGAGPPQPPPVPPEASGLSVTLVGTMFIIGAMAANVIAFRHSRWAVGKDIHRAWETHQKRTAERAERAQRAARARREVHERMAEARRRAEKAERERMEQQRSYQAEERARRDRQQRDEAREAYKTWERAFGGGGVFREFRVEFDPRLMEEILRMQRRGRSPFGMPEQILDELLRAMQQQQQQQQQKGRRRDFDDFDAFRFWEQMQGARWRDFETGHQRTNQGVFHRANNSRHYAALGLQPGASDEEIKKAYRKEVMKWHPDRYRGNDRAGAEKKFRQVTEAYNALTK